MVKGKILAGLGDAGHSSRDVISGRLFDGKRLWVIIVLQHLQCSSRSDHGKYNVS